VPRLEECGFGGLAYAQRQPFGLQAGEKLSPKRLREIACNYTLPFAKWLPVEQIELVEDPVPLAVDLRYPPSVAPDTLRRLMRFAEALIARRPEPSPAPTIATI